jgi:hypothetical protein
MYRPAPGWLAEQKNCRLLHQAIDNIIVAFIIFYLINFLLLQLKISGYQTGFREILKLFYIVSG